MKQVKILVDAEPIPAARPRFGNGRAYQPKRNRDFREIVRLSAVAAMDGAEPMKGEVTATILLFRRFKPTARNFGDCDNLAKLILDGLNGIVFVDDAQVVSLTVEKFQDRENPRAEITLFERQGTVETAGRAVAGT